MNREGKFHMKVKRGAALLCAACLIGTGAYSLPAAAVRIAAEEETAKETAGLKYEAADGSVTITGFTSELKGEVTVPAEIEGLPVTKIGEGAFRYNTKVTAITLPDSVTEIGKESFKSCFHLKTVTLSKNLTSIPDNTFQESRELESLAVPEKVRSIGELAFAQCLSLLDLTLPEKLETVGEDAFLNTPWMDAKRAENPFVIINHVLIDGKACRGDVTIPADVTKIGAGAFSYDHEVVNILVPETVTEIDRYGIFDCNRLETVTVLNPDCIICDMKATISNNYARHVPYMLGKIRGYENSTVQAYAERYEYPFEAVSAVKGDVDLNGIIAAEDAQGLLNIVAETVAENDAKLNEMQKTAADVNADGTINAADAQLILTYYVQNTVAGVPTEWDALLR